MMDIQSITGGFATPIQPQKKESSEKSEEKEEKKDRVDLKKDASQVLGYSSKGEVASVKSGTSNKPMVTQYQIKKEIWSQAYTLLKAYSEKSGTLSGFEEGMAKILSAGNDSEDPIGLNAYYNAHPEDWQQVQRGEIPDYFNMENTGERILQIWVGDGSAGSMSASQLKDIKDYIGQAYGDVSKMLGGLPGLVTDTQDYINNRLDALIAEAEKNPATAESVQ